MVEYVYKFKSDPTIAESKIKPKSIVDKPDSKADEPSFMDTFYDSLSSFFSSEEDAKRALSPKEKDTKAGEQDVYDAYESAMENRRMREAMGITQSLVEGGGEAYRKKPPEGTITRPVARPDELVSDTAKDVEESAPVTAETEEETTPVATQGAGLMSPMFDTKGETPEEATTTSTYSTAVEDLYTDFTEGNQEGTEAHIGQDKQNITLPAGIVADGLKYDGKSVTQGANTIKAADFDKTKLDTSGAYKEVDGVKIKRSDYTSDVEFSKAVLEGFEDVAKTKAGTDWDSMPSVAKKAMLKVGWNKGPGWLKGSTAGAAYKELAKDNPSASALYPKILTGSTLAPKKDGTIQGASIGIAKARADAMNALKDVLKVNEITKVVADNSGTNTAFKYYDSAGTLVHTEQTDRASSLYANKAVEVKKNAKGEW